MPYTPDALAFQVATVVLPPVAPRSSMDVTLVWKQPLAHSHYQVGLAAELFGGDCIVKTQTSAAVLVTVTAGDRPIRMGTPLTAAALFY